MKYSRVISTSLGYLNSQEQEIFIDDFFITIFKNRSNWCKYFIFNQDIIMSLYYYQERPIILYLNKKFVNVTV